MASWSDEEVRQLAVAYFHVLRDETAGRRAVKAAMLNGLDAGGFERGLQNRKDKCARISEQLEIRGLPTVAGWRSPGSVGRSPTSAANQEQIWRVIEPMLAVELGVGPTSDPAELEVNAARLTWITAGGVPPLGVLAPTRVDTSTSRFLRDPAVVRYVREVAAGRCESCGASAPFVTEARVPFLEIHHVRPLAQGGSDRTSNAVALCPNCHRRYHHGADRHEAAKALYGNVARLVME